MNKEINDKLEKKWQEYNADVDYIALTVFHKQVKPYLQKHNYHFLAGNGTYFIWEMVDNKNVAKDPDIDLPKWLYDILEQEIPGMYANSLGTIMPDYHPE